MDKWSLTKEELEAFFQAESTQASYKIYQAHYQAIIDNLQGQIEQNEIIRQRYVKGEALGNNLNIINWIIIVSVTLLLGFTDIIPSEYIFNVGLGFFIYLVIAFIIVIWHSVYEDRLKQINYHISSLDSKIFFYQQIGKILLLADLPKETDFTGYMVNGSNKLWFLALENSYPYYFIIDKIKGMITPLSFADVIDISFKNDEQRRVIQAAQPNNALSRAIIGGVIAGKVGAAWGVISSDPAQPEIVDYVPVNFRVEIVTLLSLYPLITIACNNLDQAIQLDDKLNTPLFAYRANKLANTK